MASAIGPLVAAVAVSGDEIYSGKVIAAQRRWTETRKS
jgi:hypothetical protein